jgi:hypothetical protein
LTGCFFAGTGIGDTDDKEEPAPVVLPTADAGFIFAVSVLGCGFGLVTFLLAAAETVPVLAIAELFFDADADAFADADPLEAVVPFDVVDCLAELGVTLTWLFFLPQALQPS